MADIFDEVSEDLRAERAKRLAVRYGGWVLVAALLIVAGVAGWQVWQAREAARSAAVAGRYLTALRASGEAPPGAEPPDRAKAAAELASLADAAPAGYRTLARLRLAALRAEPALTTGAVEEMLRWANPVHYMRRTATADTELGGVAIPAGVSAGNGHGAANPAPLARV